MCSKTLPKDFFDLEKKQDILVFKHFPPEILEKADTQLYGADHDMYSLGILMFELAFTKSAYQEEIVMFKIETLQSFVRHAQKNFPHIEDEILYQRNIDVPLIKWKLMMKKCFLRDVKSHNWAKDWQSLPC